MPRFSYFSQGEGGGDPLWLCTMNLALVLPIRTNLIATFLPKFQRVCGPPVLPSESAHEYHKYITMNCHPLHQILILLHSECYIFYIPTLNTIFVSALCKHQTSSLIQPQTSTFASGIIITPTLNIYLVPVWKSAFTWTSDFIEYTLNIIYCQPDMSVWVILKYISVHQPEISSCASNIYLALHAAFCTSLKYHFCVSLKLSLCITLTYHDLCVSLKYYCTSNWYIKICHPAIYYTTTSL